MAFLKNAWYCAGFGADLTDAPTAIKIIGEDVVLFRDSEGTAIALEDRCPHRFAPLSLGKVMGDCIQCPYHGLEYDATGACVLNPHGAGIIPPRAKVKAYTLLEQHGVMWIWMGDPELADRSKILPLPYITDERYAVAHGRVYLPNVNYELINDNLLDLTHVFYIHNNTVGIPEEEDMGSKMTHSVEIKGDVVRSNYFFSDIPPSNQLNRFFDGERGDMWADLTWYAPSSMHLDLSMSPIGGPRGDFENPTDGLLLHPIAHLITPESETSTHYFYAMCRSTKLDDIEGTKYMGDMAQRTFGTEDGPMAQAAFSRMGDADFWDLQPAILETDRAAVTARRILARMIAREQGRSVPQAVQGPELVPVEA